MRRTSFTFDHVPTTKTMSEFLVLTTKTDSLVENRQILYYLRSEGKQIHYQPKVLFC